MFLHIVDIWTCYFYFIFTNDTREKVTRAEVISVQSDDCCKNETHAKVTLCAYLIPTHKNILVLG